MRPVRRVGTSAGLRVGQSVFAIGTPLGFSRTLTAGVVSGLDRSIPSPAGTITRGAIQVDPPRARMCRSLLIGGASQLMSHISCGATPGSHTCTARRADLLLRIRIGAAGC